MTTKSCPTTPPHAHAEGFHLLTTPQAAAALGIGKRTLQERVSAREIATVKIGKSVRFDPADLKAYVERCKLKAIGWKDSK